MYLLTYVNKTNPDAYIKGHCIVTDEELTQFTLKVEAIKTEMVAGNRFIFAVGQGFIMHETAANIDESYSVQEITETDLEILQDYGIDKTGFARHFVDGVINLSESSFIDIPDEPNE